MFNSRKLITLIALLSTPFIINSQSLDELPKVDKKELCLSIPIGCQTEMSGFAENRNGWLRITAINEIYGFTGRFSKGIFFKVFYSDGENVYLYQKGSTRGLAVSFHPKFEGVYYVKMYHDVRPCVISVDCTKGSKFNYELIGFCERSKYKESKWQLPKRSTPSVNGIR